jgi:prepilin-type processing-associated H-X9-DG protein
MPNGTHTSGAYQVWYSLIFPYMKNWQLLNCPSEDSALYYDGSYRITTFPYAYNYMAPVPAGGACGTVWNCGVNLGPTNSSTSNTPGTALAAIEDPSGTIAVLDGSTGLTWFYKGLLPTEDELMDSGACAYSASTYYYAHCLRARHLGTINTLFVDGHVKAMQWQTILGSDSDPNVIRYWTTAADPLIH